MITHESEAASAPEPAHWKVLRMLKESRGEVIACSTLASRLEIGRAAIPEHIRTLESLGYVIESHPRDGYRLLDVPDLLIPEEIVPNLTTSWLGRPYLYFPKIGSTNEHALHLALQGAPHGCLVVADEQTRGRGRLRRPWISPPGCGLYMSVVLRTPLPVRDAHQSTLVAALALVHLLRTHYRLPAAIKWPNDVLIEHKKVAGILTEMQSDQDLTRFLVIGIGVNVNHQASTLAGPLRYPATSLAMELGNLLKRQDFLLAFLHRLEAHYERFLQEGFATALQQLEEASVLLGKTITIRSGSGEIMGKALGFTPEGALRLRTKDKKEELIWVGDVTQVEGDF